MVRSPTSRWDVGNAAAAGDRALAREPAYRSRSRKGEAGRLAAILSEARADVAVVAAYGVHAARCAGRAASGASASTRRCFPSCGAAPAQWAIARVLEETGVTIMQMDAGLDTGEIRLQKRIAIARDETGETLLEKLGVLGAEALSEALDLLTKGKLPRTPQDHARATLAPLLTRDDGRVDFKRTAVESDQRRRGFTPWPGAWTSHSGAVLKIHAAAPLDEAPGRPPGEIVRAAAFGVDVACAGSLWRLLELQLEGKKRLAAGPFIQGTRLQAGDRLGT